MTEAMINQDQKCRERLMEHYARYPLLEIRDIFKFLFQSALGSEHLMVERSKALQYIKAEYESMQSVAPFEIDALDGAYFRLHLGILNEGMVPETLAELFHLSARREPFGEEALEKKLKVARALIEEGKLPFDCRAFDEQCAEWRDTGYLALHHSEVFRAAYHPAYRVVNARFQPFLRLFCTIDRLLAKGPAVIAIEGGSASGKTTLSFMLKELYGCEIIHMDDFFLRPEQRTRERFAEVGGNIDRERFLSEVLLPLREGKTVCYRPFNCSKGCFGDAITLEKRALTVVEGVYSMHPAFADFYDYTAFLDIDAESQKKRIMTRNSPEMAKRFFKEWIPLEARYFSEMRIKERCNTSIVIKE